jgi:hypothetical protein
MSNDIKNEQGQAEATAPEQKLSQSTYEQLRNMNEYILNGVRFVKLSNLGPMAVTPLPRFTQEQERRLEAEQRIERVLASMSKPKEKLLTPEEDEEAFQVYMHRRMKEAQGGVQRGTPKRDTPPKED